MMDIRPATTLRNALTMPRVAQVSAAVTGVLLGIAMGLLVTHGRVWPLVALPLVGASVWAQVRAMVPPNERERVGAVVALSFGLHAAVAVFLFTASLAVGRGGFLPGDDAEYAHLSRNFVAYIRGELDPALGPPWWGGELYLFAASGTWVYLESAIFFLIGPEVLVPILLNSAFALSTSLLVYDMTRRLFDRRAAMLALSLTAFFPSLLLWSSLNLKEAIALQLLALCVWSLIRFHDAPRWWPLVTAIATLVLLQNVRGYLAVGLAFLMPVLVALTPKLTFAARVRWTSAAVVGAAVFLSLNNSGISLGPQVLESFQAVRAGMAHGARTAFVEPPPVVVSEGDTYVVPGGPPSGASRSPTVFHVAPDTRIIVLTGDEPPPRLERVVVVRPGDIVVVGGPDRTPAPPEARRELEIAAGAPNAVETSVGSSAKSVTFRAAGQGLDALVRRTIVDLPLGVAFALFGPFPWLLERRADLLLLPELLLWYVCLAAAARTVVRERHSWRTLAPVALLVAGLLGLFSLVEGNWGTLIRHRAMAIPFTVVLAAPALWSLAVRLTRRPDRP